MIVGRQRLVTCDRLTFAQINPVFLCQLNFTFITLVQSFGRSSNLQYFWILPDLRHSVSVYHIGIAIELTFLFTVKVVALFFIFLFCHSCGSIFFCQVYIVLSGDLFMLQPINNADFIVPVEIDGTEHQVHFVLIFMLHLLICLLCLWL